MIINIKAYDRVILGLLAIIPAITVILPRSIAFSAGIISLFILYGEFSFSKIKPAAPPVLIKILAPTIFLCIASIIWAAEPEEALHRTVKLLAIFLVGGLLITSILALRGEQIRICSQFLPIGIVAAAILIAAELLFDAPLYRLMRLLAADQSVDDTAFNRGTVAVVLCFFPALSILLAQGRAFVLTALFIVTVLAMLILVESQSAQFSMFFGLLTYAFFPYRSKQAWYLLAFLISALIFLAPFLAIWLFEPLAATLNALPFFGQGSGFAGARMEIWDYVSRYALQNPLYGFGLEAARAIDSFDSKELFQNGSTTIHPHNFAIQLWLEFGVLGAAAGALFCSYLLRTIFTLLTPVQRRAALPAFIASLSVASTGYGMWQSWWIGLLFVVTAFVVLAVRRLDQAETTEHAPAAERRLRGT